MQRVSAKLLLLTELAILLLFFCFSAVVCANLFMKADETASRAQKTDWAVIESTTVAETLKSSNGNLNSTGDTVSGHGNYEIEEDTLSMFYNDRMTPSPKDTAAYRVDVKKTSLPAAFSYDIQIKEIIREPSGDVEIYALRLKTLALGGGDNE